MPCITCGHGDAFHETALHNRMRPCRIKGCKCTALRMPPKEPPIESDPICDVVANTVRIHFCNGVVPVPAPEVLTPREARVLARRLLDAADEAEA